LLHDLVVPVMFFFFINAFETHVHTNQSLCSVFVLDIACL